MAGHSDSYTRFPQFIDSAYLAINSFVKAIEQVENFNPRLKEPQNGFKIDNLVTAQVQKKQKFDRAFALDSSLVNSLLLKYGKDLSAARVHTGPYAEEITHRAGADALTSGKNIYFSSGSFAPHTEEGQALLLHEAEHVNQHLSGQRQLYKEDIEKSEREAYNLEGITALDNEKTELFDRFKQDSLIFKERDLNEGLEASEKDLEDYSGTERPIIYRYHSRSGRVHELTEGEYKSCLEELKKRLEEYLEEKMMYGLEEEKTKTMEQIVKIFNPQGVF